jgi:hypothetical protein
MTEVILDVQKYTKLPRAEIVELLQMRDGDFCMHPDCGKELDFDRVPPADGSSDPLEVTIDHWLPQCYGKANGWTMDQIWDLDNLKLMHKKCNAKKGDLIPNEDGTIPAKPQSKFRFRRQKRAGRPELCTECNNGHNLFRGEVCANCGCNAQRFPMSAKVRLPDCDHKLWWCWLCSITPDMRPSAVDMSLLQGESGEWPE